MPLYFAYGSNMDVAAMAARCPRSKAIGLARLMRHRLVVMREGWLSAARDPHAAVHGVLWDVAFSDVAALDRYEDVAGGLYRKALQAVTTAAGAKRALVYFGANVGPGVAPGDYMMGVIDAARHWRLPPSAIAALEALAPTGAKASPAESPRVRHRFASPLDRDRTS